MMVIDMDVPDTRRVMVMTTIPMGTEMATYVRTYPANTPDQAVTLLRQEGLRDQSEQVLSTGPWFVPTSYDGATVDSRRTGHLLGPWTNTERAAVAAGVAGNGDDE